MIGLLVTGDGISIAHHVFDGSTRDSTNMGEAMADLQARFGVGRIALIATRLRRDPDVTAVIQAAASDDTVWSTSAVNAQHVRSSAVAAAMW